MMKRREVVLEYDERTETCSIELEDEFGNSDVTIFALDHVDCFYTDDDMIEKLEAYGYDRPRDKV